MARPFGADDERETGNRGGGDDGVALGLKEFRRTKRRTACCYLDPVLLARETADADTSIDPPRIEQLISDLGDDYQLLAAREGNVTLVEQMIDVRRQQQPIGAIETLGIGRISPRLDVARLQMSGLVHTSDAATLFAEKNVGPEHALPTPGADDLIAKRRARESAVGRWWLDVNRFCAL